MRRAAALALLVAAGAAHAQGGGALEDAAARLAAEAAESLPGGTPLALAVAAADPALARAVEVAFARAWTGAVIAAGSCAEARERGVAAWAELRATLDGDALQIAGALRGCRENFFTGLPLVAGRTLSARVAADGAALALAGRRARPRLERVASLPEEPLAVATARIGGRRVFAALGREALYLIDDGRLDARPHPPARPGAVAARDPAGGLAFEGPALRWALPARGAAGRLVHGGSGWRAEAAGSGDVPLAPGWSGAAEPGTNRILPLLQGPAGGVDAERPIVAFAAHGDRVAVLAATGEVFVREGRAWAPAGRAGAIALADLDGDGRAELVRTAEGGPERIAIDDGGRRRLSLAPGDGIAEAGARRAAEPRLTTASGGDGVVALGGRDAEGAALYRLGAEP